MTSIIAEMAVYGCVVEDHPDDCYVPVYRALAVVFDSSVNGIPSREEARELINTAHPYFENKLSIKENEDLFEHLYEFFKYAQGGGQQYSESRVNKLEEKHE